MATAAKELVPARGRKVDGRARNGGKRVGAGRPQWQPEIKKREVSPGVWRDENQAEAWERARNEVRHYVAIGYPQEVIVRLLTPSISEDTLRKHFAYELENGKLINDAKIAGTGFWMAQSGRHPDMTRFWLRARMGWRDSGDVPGAMNAPITFEHIPGDDW